LSSIPTYYMSMYLLLKTILKKWTWLGKKILAGRKRKEEIPPSEVDQSCQTQKKGGG
jgi:hypothetical protein